MSSHGGGIHFCDMDPLGCQFSLDTPGDCLGNKLFLSYHPRSIFCGMDHLDTLVILGVRLPIRFGGGFKIGIVADVDLFFLGIQSVALFLKRLDLGGYFSIFKLLDLIA